MSTENLSDVNDQQVRPNSDEFREATTWNANIDPNSTHETAATTTDSPSIE